MVRCNGNGVGPSSRTGQERAAELSYGFHSVYRGLISSQQITPRKDLKNPVPFSRRHVDHLPLIRRWIE